MENFEMLQNEFRNKRIGNEQFQIMLAMIQEIANCSDEEHTKFYQMATANEGCETVKAVLADASKMRIAFGAIAGAMQRTGACPETKDKVKFDEFINAFIDELIFIDRLNQGEIEALVASMTRDWMEQNAANPY